MVSLLANMNSKGTKEEKQPQKEAPEEFNEAYDKVVKYGKHIYYQEQRKDKKSRKSGFLSEQVSDSGNEYSMYMRFYSSPQEKRSIQNTLDNLLKDTRIELYHEGNGKYTNFVIFLNPTDSEKRLTAKMVLMEVLSGYSYDEYLEWQKGQDESTLDSIIGDRVL